MLILIAELFFIIPKDNFILNFLFFVLFQIDCLPLEFHFLISLLYIMRSAFDQKSHTFHLNITNSPPSLIPVQ